MQRYPEDSAPGILRGPGGPDLMGNRALRWGLLGTGGMARRFARELRAAGMPVTAVGGRDGEKARALAAGEGIPGYHGSYASLLADPSVDAVHLSLPNALHADWSALAAAAGKHVLCEKPAALTAGEADRMLAAARSAGVFLMEGFMYRFHPQWDLAAALVEDGRVGRPRRLEAAFAYDLAASGRGPGDIRLRPETGGGALLDVGCYCLSALRMLAGAEPLVVEAAATLAPGTGVDARCEARLVFPGGVEGILLCALDGPRRHAVAIVGEEGRIELDAPWHPDPERAEVRLVLPGEAPEIYRAGDGLGAFVREARLVEEHVDAKECPLLPREEIRAQAAALEAVRRAAGLM